MVTKSHPQGTIGTPSLGYAGLKTTFEKLFSDVSY